MPQASAGNLYVRLIPLSESQVVAQRKRKRSPAHVPKKSRQVAHASLKGQHDKCPPSIFAGDVLQFTKPYTLNPRISTL